MSDDLIEQAAEAICDAHVGDGCKSWEDEDEVWRDTYRDMARAALELVEPAIRAQAITDVVRKWQFGGWAILTPPVTEPSAIKSLALGNRVTDWLRDLAAQQGGGLSC